MTAFPLRIVAVSWGLIELTGFLFTTGEKLSATHAAYAVLPPLALITCGLIPATWVSNRPVKLALLFLLFGAVARRVYTVAQELSDTPPYFLAAALQAVTLVLLVVFIARALRKVRNDLHA
jgi:hypothetical protein